MGEPCRKCKSWRPLAGDTWCVGCSAWETIGLELAGHWNGPSGLRSIGNDLVLGCAREVRALRALGAGLGRAPSAPSSLPSAPGRERSPTPAAPSTAAKVKPAQPPSEYTYCEESEEERKVIDKRPALVRKTPPPGSGGDTSERGLPSSGVKEEAPSEDRRGQDGSRTRRRRSEERDERSEKKGSNKEKKDKKKDKDKKKRKRKRGRKHQRLHKLAEDPYRPHHRKLSAGFLDDRERL